MNCDLTGKRIWAQYLGMIAVSGVVQESRPSYYGRLVHSIALDESISHFDIQCEAGQLVDVDDVLVVRVMSV